MTAPCSHGHPGSVHFFFFVKLVDFLDAFMAARERFLPLESFDVPGGTETVIMEEAAGRDIFFARCGLALIGFWDVSSIGATTVGFAARDRLRSTTLSLAASIKASMYSDPISLSPLRYS